MERKVLKKTLSSKDFWIEYIALFFSIFLTTFIVQTIVFRIKIIVVLLCLIKSLFTTIPNVLAIMFGRRKEIVKKNNIIGAMVYAFSSLPYIDLVILFVYKLNIYFTFEVLITYIIVYFCVGLFVDKYILFVYKILRKIFYGNL